MPDLSPAIVCYGDSSPLHPECVAGITFCDNCDYIPRTPKPPVDWFLRYCPKPFKGRSCNNYSCRCVCCREARAACDSSKNWRANRRNRFTHYARFTPDNALSDVDMLASIRRFVGNVQKWCATTHETCDWILYPHKKSRGLLHWEGPIRCSSPRVERFLRQAWVRLRGVGRWTYSLTPPKTASGHLTYGPKLSRQNQQPPIILKGVQVIVRAGKRDRPVADGDNNNRWPASSCPPTLQAADICLP